ncbi:hypothetical protein [Facklamia hominis]
MKIIQFIKKVNATEVGAMNTNETYISVTKNVDLSDMFPNFEEVKTFRYKKNKSKEYLVRLQTGREIRIVGLGIFYRDYDITPGTRVILEKIIHNDGSEDFLIDYEKSKELLCFQFNKSKGFRILNEENFETNEIKSFFYDGEIGVLNIKFREESKPRIDSKVVLKYYDLVFNGRVMEDDFVNNDILEIVFEKNIYWLVRDIPYQKIYMEA